MSTLWQYPSPKSRGRSVFVNRNLRRFMSRPALTDYLPGQIEWWLHNWACHCFWTDRSIDADHPGNKHFHHADQWWSIDHLDFIYNMISYVMKRGNWQSRDPRRISWVTIVLSENAKSGIPTCGWVEAHHNVKGSLLEITMVIVTYWDDMKILE